MAKKEKDKHDRRDAELQASLAVAGQEAEPARRRR